MSTCISEIKAHADALLDTADSEVSFRCVIGRLYYFGFHSAVEINGLLLLPEPAGDLKGTHEKLIQKFIGAGAAKDVGITPTMKKTINSIGLILRDLKQYRTTSDYKLNEEVTKNHAEFVKARVEKLFEHCESVNSSLLGKTA